MITDTAPTAPSPVTADRPAPGSSRRETAAERRARPCFHDIAVSAADKHGVCVRPLVMHTLDLDTGDSDYMAVACKSTMESQCPSCAKNARLLRMQQLRDGWHLDHEPVEEPNAPSEVQTALLAHRADLVVAYRAACDQGETAGAEELREKIESADTELRASGMRGRIPSPDAPATITRTRSTRRRQDAPDLPTRQVRKTTVGREYAGKYRPSMFLTLTCDSYGPIRNGAPVDPDTYDYRRAARDAIHFSALVDRVMQNLPARPGMGGPVLRDGRTAETWCTASARRVAGRDPPPDHPPGCRRHLPPGLVAPPRPPRIRKRPRGGPAAVGSGCAHVHRPAHPYTADVVG